MRTLIKGRIAEFTPQVLGRVAEDGVLVLGEAGDLEFTVDTGFSAGISLPESDLRRLAVEHIGFEPYVLATGEVIELSVYYGKVRLRGQEVEVRFIPADFLIGMEFMASVASRLVVDFDRQALVLQRR